MPVLKHIEDMSYNFSATTETYRYYQFETHTSIWKFCSYVV